MCLCQRRRLSDEEVDDFGAALQDALDKTGRDR